MNHRATGFRQKEDSRDEAFPLEALLTARGEIPIAKFWKPGPVRDQGNVGACVGHACWQLLKSEPYLQESHLDPFDIWREARKIDEFNDDLTEGTSVRAGLNVLKNNGLIKSYYWAKNIDQVVQYLTTLGPLVFGTRWSDSMFTPAKDGFIKPANRGGSGHAYFAYGANMANKSVRFRNSWGESFGIEGDFFMSFSDVDRLLKEGGVAAAVVES